MYDLLPIKKTARMPLLQEVRGVTLTTSAVQMILSIAEVVSEGETESSESGKSHIYRGSTLVTVDMNKVPLDITKTPETLEHLRSAVARSLLLRIGLMRIARKEAERRAYPRFPREMSADTAFRIVDNRLLIDIDIECPLADVMGRRDARKARTVK
jgi:hypothetical protein